MSQMAVRKLHPLNGFCLLKFLRNLVKFYLSLRFSKFGQAVPNTGRLNYYSV